MRSLVLSLFAVGVTLIFLLGRPAAAQTTYSWNYSGPNWNTPANWSPLGGPPTAADTAILGHFDGTTYTPPTFTANAATGELAILGPRPQFNSTIVGNGNTLTLGTGGVMSVAPLTERSTSGHSLALDNLTVNIANGTSFAAGFAQTVGAMELSGFSSRIALNNGSQLRLVNAGGTVNHDLTLNSGAQLLVNSGTQITNGIGVNGAVQGAIRFHGGGQLNFQGASTGITTFNANQVVAASGHSTVRVLFGGSLGGGAVTILNLGNNTLQRGIDRFTRDSAGTVISLGTGTTEFDFGSSPIPGFSGSQAELVFRPGPTGVPMQNGVITENTSSNSNSPYVILTGNVPGIVGITGRFATWNSTTGAVTAQLGVQRTEAILSATLANENVIYRPTSSNATATLTGNISPQTVVFEPRGTNQTVNLGGFTMTTPGIIAERVLLGPGPFNFNLTNGTVTTPGGSPLNIYVLGGSNTFFNVGATFVNTNGSLVKSGTGTMVLTGSSLQLNNVLDIYINQGILRARIDGASANLGTTNVLNLRGGVLEVDANNGTSTFSRALGQDFNEVNWNFATSAMLSDRGGGGFSVFNGNLNVNIGGGQNLVWNGNTDGNEFFIRSGQSLRLGSFQSTGVVTLQNNLALDDGSASLPPESREIIAECLNPTPFPLSSQRARITGVISGSAASGIMKSGPGMLELTGANTYAGGTTVAIGHLVVNNTSGSATGTGRVIVFDTLLGNGFIAPSNGNGVTIMPGAVSNALGLALYRDQAGGTPGNLTIGSAGTNNPVTLRPGSLAVVQLNGTTFDPNGGPTSYSRLTVLGSGAITLTGATLSVGLNTGFTPANSDLFGILNNQTGNPITGTFANGATVNAFFPGNSPAGTFQISYFGNITGSTITIDGGNDVVLYNFQPVPEPASILAISAGAVGLAGVVRRVPRRDAR